MLKYTIDESEQPYTEINKIEKGKNEMYMYIYEYEILWIREKKKNNK